MSRICAVVAATAIACGAGTSKPSATFEGTVRGQTMKPADAISAPAHVSLAAIGADVIAIVISDSAGTCAKVSAGSEPAGARALVLFLGDVDGFTVTAPASTGTFNVYDPSSGGLPPARVAVATFGVNDAQCNPVAGQSAVATSGSVKITSISGAAYGGTYAIGFDTGETISGEFHTGSCPRLADFFGTVTHSCG